MSREKYEEIKKYLDMDGALFDTLTVTISLVGGVDSQDNPYRIAGIDCSPEKTNFDSKRIRASIEAINKELLNEDNTGFDSTQKNPGWSIFFLIKECIQRISNEICEFKYYRGQRNGKWDTIPSAFRDIMNDDCKNYHSEFENIYEDIYIKFPEKIKYIKFPKTGSLDEYNDLIRERGQQLSLLQHYELYTPLLDITSNPYIALLFMTSGKLEEPQLELYDISKSPLFMEPIRTQLNNRILAQKGAFLNYEMLLSKTEEGVTLIEELKNNANTSLKIPRVILKIKYQSEKTLDEYLIDKKKRESVKENLSDKRILNLSQEVTKEIDDFEGDLGADLEDWLQKLKNELDELDLFPTISDETNLNEENKEKIRQEETIYEAVLKDLRRKLREFNYIADDLFPDFEDYLKSKMKSFI